MPDTVTTITTFINSPPGQLVAGGVLAGIVWKFFERVEAVLTDQTKVEIATWLAGVKVGQRVEPWPDTFAKLFDRVFGFEHGTLPRFSSTCVATVVSSFVSLVIAFSLYGWHMFIRIFGPTSEPFRFIVVSAGVLGSNLLLGYFLSVIVRAVLGYRSSNLAAGAFEILFLLMLLVSFVTSAVFGVGSIALPHMVQEALHNMLAGFHEPVMVLWVFPSLFPLNWLLLYAGSGFLLKGARRFDIGFQWFNRKFDIEKKRLQSIGLVAGALVAIVYWAAVLVARFV